jgi:hypothetical protein
VVVVDMGIWLGLGFELGTAYVPLVRLAEAPVPRFDAEARNTRDAANPSRRPPAATAHGWRRANEATSSRIWSELEFRR